MIQKFVDRFMAAKPALEAKFKNRDNVDSYEGLVRLVIETISVEDGYRDEPDPKRIHEIDDGDYQGTLVYVIGSYGYQPSRYWYVTVSYGSCSGCDALQAAIGYGDEINPQGVEDLMSLALHIAQGLHQMHEDE